MENDAGDGTRIREDPLGESGKVILGKAGRVVLILLAFAVTSWRFPSLIDAFDPYPFDRWSQYEAYAYPGYRIGWSLNLFDIRAPLLASLLLYFRVARKGDGCARRLARGEIFTGILNLHIIITALASPLIALGTKEFNALGVGAFVLSEVILTATWVLIGFHLCEGRLITPLGGLALAVLVRVLLSLGDVSFLFRGLASMGAFLLNFGWQLRALLREGDGFDLFPTGLWPAMRRCGKTFVCVALVFWILSGRGYHLIVDFAFRGDVGLYWRHATIGVPRFLDAALAYLVPLAFLSWSERGEERGLLRLALICWGITSFLSLLCWLGLLLQLDWPPFLPELLYFSPLGIVMLPLSAGWRVFVPLAACVWWIRGNYLFPLIPAAVALLVGGSIIAVEGSHDLVRTGGEWTAVAGELGVPIAESVGVLLTVGLLCYQRAFSRKTGTWSPSG